jgi:hypothetical protein
MRILRDRMLYRLVRPEPPCYRGVKRGPALVVGSAPASNPPLGLDDSFLVISVNGSQVAARAWGVEAPDVTLMYGNQLRGTNMKAVEVRRVLSGRRTGELYVTRWHESIEALLSKLEAFDYRCERAFRLTRFRRMALHEAVFGSTRVFTGYSTGVNAVLFALHSGAPAVIVTGIDPGSDGHVYNDLGKKREHVSADARALVALRERGFPLFTSDPAVAESLGLPLWTGRIRE